MKKRKLGKLSVSAMGYGCMGLSGTYGASDDKAAIALLRNVVELGVDFFDTADAYGPFRNEQLVGEALAPVRDKVIIATKFGQEFLADGSRRVNGRPDYVRSACEAHCKNAVGKVPAFVWRVAGGSPEQAHHYPRRNHRCGTGRY